MIGVSKSVLSKVRILKEYFAENPAVIYYKGKEMKSQTEGLDSTSTPLSK